MTHTSLETPWPTPVARAVYAVQCAQMAARMAAEGDHASAKLNADLAAIYALPPK